MSRKDTSRKSLTCAEAGKSTEYYQHQARIRHRSVTIEESLSHDTMRGSVKKNVLPLAIGLCLAFLPLLPAHADQQPAKTPPADVLFAVYPAQPAAQAFVPVVVQAIRYRLTERGLLPATAGAIAARPGAASRAERQTQRAAITIKTSRERRFRRAIVSLLFCGVARSREWRSAVPRPIRGSVQEIYAAHSLTTETNCQWVLSKSQESSSLSAWPMQRRWRAPSEGSDSEYGAALRPLTPNSGGTAPAGRGRFACWEIFEAQAARKSPNTCYLCPRSARSAEEGGSSEREVLHLSVLVTG